MNTLCAPGASSVRSVVAIAPLALLAALLGRLAQRPEDWPCGCPHPDLYQDATGLQLAPACSGRRTLRGTLTHPERRRGGVSTRTPMPT
jgi:hypothetical protein